MTPDDPTPIPPTNPGDIPDPGSALPSPEDEQPKEDEGKDDEGNGE